jgi:Fic family protein
MFDPKQPYNELPLLPGWFDYHSTDILKAAIKANNALAKLNGLTLLLPNVNLLICPLLTKESVESNAIENINTTTTMKVLQAEAMNIDVNKITGAEKEVLHYRSALLWWIEKMKKFGGIPTNLLIELQQKLEPSKRGIRNLPGTIIANKKAVLYTPPVWEELLRSLLTNLEKRMHTNKDDIDPLIKVWVIHYQFESIHPFYDGNGRTGRMLMILYLIMIGKLDHPILFLSEYINQNRSKYYTLLNRTWKTNDYKEFIIYTLDAITQQSLLTQQKIITIKDLIASTEQKIKDTGIVDYHRVTTILFSQPFITINNLADQLQVTRQTITNHINKLSQQHIIKEIKIGRNKLICIPEFINQLI